MNKDEALKMAIREMSIYAMQHFNDWLIDDEDLIKAINACKEALEQPAQPLSDYEIRQIIAKEGIPVRTGNTAVRFARAIEQAHGIGEKR